MSDDDFVSPYLRRPLRSLAEACEDISRRRGLTLPDCRGCVFRNDRLCDHPLKALARHGRGRRKPAGNRQTLPKAA